MVNKNTAACIIVFSGSKLHCITEIEKQQGNMYIKSKKCTILLQHYYNTCYSTLDLNQNSSNEPDNTLQ